jgi:hypothetical protein
MSSLPAAVLDINIQYEVRTAAYRKLDLCRSELGRARPEPLINDRIAMSLFPGSRMGVELIGLGGEHKLEVATKIIYSVQPNFHICLHIPKPLSSAQAAKIQNTFCD